MKCQYFLNKHCLSCDLLSQDYSTSIAIKEQILSDLFPDQIRRIKPSIICKNGTEGTRNKAKLAVTLVQGNIEFGFHDNRLQFKEQEHCPLHAAAINNILEVLKAKLLEYKIIPYDVHTKHGEVKYILLTYSQSTKQLLIRFVLRSTECIARLRKLTTDILSSHPVISVVTANIQEKHQAILEGEEEFILSVQDCIPHQFDDYILFQGARSFFQTNTEIALELYRQFQRELSTLSVKSLLDLYCGVGAFSFFAEKYCDSVTGVEISDAAIFYANKARELNKSQKINFLSMDAEAFLNQQDRACFDAILVNPPRRGLNENIISQLLRLHPQYVFYSSCNAETLKRDYSQLAAQYEIQSLQLFDMFPYTRHFETLLVLKRHSPT